MNKKKSLYQTSRFDGALGYKYAPRLGNVNSSVRSGFTLIELLVVIAIIGLLASVVLVALSSARAKSRDSKRLADIRQIATAMELFFNDKGHYPTVAGAGGTIDSQIGAQIAPNFIAQAPVAPTPADGTCAGSGQNSNAYYWVTNGVSSGYGYTLTFCLGTATGAYSGGFHTLSPQGIQ